jgi:hypothetical protein
VNPLRYWATRLSVRLSEIEFKVGPFYRILDVFIDAKRLTIPRIVEIRPGSTH